jgi:ATP-binding cassette subfamily B (MDR/TAP) protein 1
MINITTIIVAHHLTTVRNDDMITVVQHGSIVEKDVYGEHSLDAV